MLKAKALYEKALADDPRYARALQGLANVHFLEWAVEKSPAYQQQLVLDRPHIRNNGNAISGFYCGSSN